MRRIKKLAVYILAAWFLFWAWVMAKDYRPHDEWGYSPEGRE